MQTTVQSHAGFDASGNVTDPVRLFKPSRILRLKLLEIRQVGVREAGKALREAIKAFRQANHSRPHQRHLSMRMVNQE